MKLVKIISAVVVGCCISLSAFAEDSDKLRNAAADRYLAAVPMEKMMNDMYNNIAARMPAEKQKQFISEMRSVVNIDNLTKITKTAMVKTFTADELNALADFYGSKHGASAMAKFGNYMAVIMPDIQSELQRGMEKLQQKQKESKGK